MLVFASIFGFGFIILIFNLIFGGDGDVDVTTDVGIDTHGPGILNVRMVALLMVGFGAAGFGVRVTTSASMFQASLAGIGGAAVVGAIGYLIIRAFYASQVSSTISDNDIIGQTGNLIDAIQDDKYGQVSCVVRGREITYLARSVDGKSIDRNAPVRIIGKTANIVSVERLS